MVASGGGYQTALDGTVGGPLRAGPSGGSSYGAVEVSERLELLAWLVDRSAIHPATITKSNANDPLEPTQPQPHPTPCLAEQQDELPRVMVTPGEGSSNTTVGTDDGSGVLDVEYRRRRWLRCVCVCLT